MPSKKLKEKMQLVNMPRPEKEKFYQTYKKNELNPNKWSPDYNKQLVDALSAARQREKQNKTLIHPGTSKYLHTYPQEMVFTFGSVYKRMHPYSKENVLAVGQKILDNPSQYPAVYHAILGTPYQQGGYTPQVKKNIEDQLVSKLGFGYQQAPTAKERKQLVKTIVDNRPQPQPEPTKPKRGRKPKQPTTPPVTTAPPQTTLLDVEKKGKKKKQPTPTPPAIVEKGKDEKPKRTAGRPKKEENKVPERFNGVEVITQPIVQPTEEPKAVKQLQKSTERFITKVPEKTLAETDRRYQPLQVETRTPIRQAHSRQEWQNSDIGLSQDQKDRGIKYKDLFYQMVNDPNILKNAQKGKYQGVSIDDGVLYAEKREDIENIGSPNIIYEGKQLSWWTHFNAETKKNDLPTHPAHMKFVDRMTEMRNPDTLEPISRLSRSNAKAVYLGMKRVEGEGERKQYQLLYEQRTVMIDPYTGKPKEYGPWELFAKTRDYSLTKKEREAEVQKIIDKMNDENPPIDLTLDTTLDWVEPPIPEPEPLPPIEPPQFDPIEPLPTLETVFTIEKEEKEIMGQIEEPNDPDQELLREITKRVNKGRVATENWFRCCRIEFGANLQDFPMLIDLAQRVENMDPRLLWKPRTEVDLWYHKWGASRAKDLIRNLEQVSGLKRNDNMQPEDNKSARRVVRYYAKRTLERVKKQLMMDGYTGDDLGLEIVRRMQEYGYEYGRDY